MRKIQFSSRATDTRILSVLLPGLIAVVVGFALPLPGPGEHPGFIGPCISVSLGIFVWGLVRIARPSRFRFSRIPGEILLVFLGWLVLVSAFAGWFRHLDKSHEIQRMYLEEVRPVL